VSLAAGVFAAAVAEWGKLTDDEKKVYTANFKVRPSEVLNALS